LGSCKTGLWTGEAHNVFGYTEKESSVYCICSSKTTMTFFERIQLSFRRLQWKLTLSYTAVTVGSLFIIVLILGYLLFSKVLVPIDILSSVLSPKAWIEIASRNVPAEWLYLLSQDPVDTKLISMLLREGDLQITYFDLFRIGDLQIRLRTAGEGSVLLVDPDGVLLGSSNPNFVPTDAIGKTLDLGVLPGLEGPLMTALSGEVDPEKLFVTIEPNERFYFAIPYMDEGNQAVLGVSIVYFERVPTENDLPANLLQLLSQSALILLLAAGLIGTIFGFLTAKGMVRRLHRVTQATEAWSQGDFSEFISDPTGDEISQLAERLNHMAEQLQQFLRRSQELAVSEERNRLARDLHDSAKQEALAASFHLGTALTLFERDPQRAKNHLAEADHLVDSVRGELTDLIHELRPPSINGDNFDETINEYLIEWAHQAGIKATLKVTGSLDVPLDVKQAIFRIMQEAIANVARHSAAEQVIVTLQYGEQRAELTVRDDGRGFDTQEHFDGIGLESMRERAESLGGDFSVFSTVGQGTQINAAFPIQGTRE
jgi:NarL family two-component system sensor histidine kinase LiaS